MKTFLKILLLLLLSTGAGPHSRAQDHPPEPELAPEAPEVPSLPTRPEKPEKPKKPRHRRPLNQDIVKTGGTVVVKTGQETGNVVVLGGSADVAGKIKGDLVVVGGAARVSSTAEIDGDAVVLGGTLDVDPGAVITGDRVNIGLPFAHLDAAWLKWPRQWFEHGLLWGRPLPYQHLWSWGVAGAFLVLYLVTALLFPASIQGTLRAVEAKPGSAFVTGLLGFLLFGLVSLLCVVTVVGTIFLPFLLLAFIAAFVVGKVAVYRYAGQQIGTQTGWSHLRNPYLALLAGTLLFFLVYAIPVLGLLLWTTVAWLGFGAALLAFSQRFSTFGTTSAAPAAGPPVILSSLAGHADLPPQEATVLERVGFLRRLAATLLDLLLFDLLWKGFHLPKHALLPCLTAYHVLLWSWKGTTLGGALLHLRILQTDGSPLTWQVALLRSLASFLSAAALFLGFFWAGWSRDKLAWHDRIAGTIVVKLPRQARL